jgi:hypothetical protein
MGNSKLSTNRGLDDVDNFERKNIATSNTSDTITHEDGDMIPDDISILILEFACNDPTSVQQLSLVSRQWYTLLMQAAKIPSSKLVIQAGLNDRHERTNMIWKRLSLRKWSVEQDINIKNWQKFYQRRKTYVDDNKGKKTFTLIDNCDDIETNCPMEYEKLFKFWNPHSDESSVNCNRCKKTVYRCSTRKEVLDHKKQGHCVAFIVKPKASPVRPDWYYDRRVG